MAAKKKEQWICVGCGANVKTGEFFFLDNREEGILCKNCSAALQFKYPMYVGENPAYRPELNMIVGPDYNTCPTHTDIYPVLALTAEQLRQELATADACREELRASFGGAENVFEVRLVHPLPKLNPLRVNIPNAIRYKNAIAVYGYVRLGIFHKGDLVELRHGGTTRDITVLLIQRGVLSEDRDPLFMLRNPDRDICFHFTKEGVSEGFPAIMLLPPDAAGIQPGDLIVAD